MYKSETKRRRKSSFGEQGESPNLSISSNEIMQIGSNVDSGMFNLPNEYCSDLSNVSSQQEYQERYQKSLKLFQSVQKSQDESTPSPNDKKSLQSSPSSKSRNSQQELKFSDEELNFMIKIRSQCGSKAIKTDINNPEEYQKKYKKSIEMFQRSKTVVKTAESRQKAAEFQRQKT